VQFWAPTLPVSIAVAVAVAVAVEFIRVPGVP
jgi:hypothetical protein